MSKDAAMERYFQEAASWDADRATMNARSARLAWRIALGACVLTGVALIALMLLMPLKRTEPFVIRVDNATGIVDVVPVFVGKSEFPEAVTRYFLTHYVTICERFNFSTAESDYEECAAFHGAARNQAWAAAWDRSNPDSPLNLHKDGSSVRVQVSAVSFFERTNGVEDLVQIRYTKIRRPPGNSTEEVTYWISTLQYVYAEPPSDARMRRWNPLGIRIVEFRSEPEVLAARPVENADQISQAGAL
ncbi:MAG: virB8 family protein [Steroidobacter sp.]